MNLSSVRVFSLLSLGIEDLTYHIAYHSDATLVFSVIKVKRPVVTSPNGM